MPLPARFGTRGSGFMFRLVPFARMVLSAGPAPAPPTVPTPGVGLVPAPVPSPAPAAAPMLLIPLDCTPFMPPAPALPGRPTDCPYAAAATPITSADATILPFTIFIAHSVTSSNCAAAVSALPAAQI